MPEVTTKSKDKYYKMSEGEINKERGDKKNFQKMVKALKQLNIETTSKRKREEDTSLLLKNEQSVIQSTGKRKNSNSIVDSLKIDFDKITLDT